METKEIIQKYNEFFGSNPLANTLKSQIVNFTDACINKNPYKYLLSNLDISVRLWNVLKIQSNDMFNPGDSNHGYKLFITLYELKYLRDNKVEFCRMRNVGKKSYKELCELIESLELNK